MVLIEWILLIACTLFALIMNPSFDDQSKCFRLHCQLKFGIIQWQINDSISKYLAWSTSFFPTINFFTTKILVFQFRLIEKHKTTYDKQKVVKLTEELEKRNSDKSLIIKELKTLLGCNDTESSELYYNHVNEIYELEWAKTNIQYLLKISVSRNLIKKYGSLLTLSFGKQTLVCILIWLKI